MEQDYQGFTCSNCGGWGDCHECHFDDYGFRRDEFLDQNSNYFKYKQFILEKYDPKDVTLWADLDKNGNGDFYIHNTHEYYKLSIDNEKVIMTPGYNPPSLQELSAKTIAKNKIPYKIFPKTLQHYITTI